MKTRELIEKLKNANGEGEIVLKIELRDNTGLYAPVIKIKDIRLLELGKEPVIIIDEIRVKKVN